MKLYLNKPYLALFFLISITAFFHSCQKEDDSLVISEISEKRTITKKIISKNEINNNLKVTEILNNIQNTKAGGDLQRIAYDSANNFYVDTDEAIYIEYGNIHSYTFFVHRIEDNNNLENLVLAVNEEGLYDAYLWKYHFNSFNEIDTDTPIEVIKLIDFDSDELLQERNDPTTGCSNGELNYVEIDWVDIEGNVYDDAGDCPGDCDFFGYWLPCPNTGGGSTDGGSTNNGSSENGSNNNESNDNGSYNSGIDNGDSGSQDTGTGGGMGGGGDSEPVVISAPKNKDGTSAVGSFLINAIGSENLSNTQISWINNPDNSDEVQLLLSHLIDIEINTHNINFIINVISYYNNNNNGFNTLDYVLYNRTSLDTNQSENSSYTIGGYDTTVYEVFNQQSSWPTVASILRNDEFIGWGSPGVERNCFEYAKAQIAIKNYEISSYFATGQTIQIYTTEDGVDIDALSEGLAYLTYALSNGIPVIVGIDSSPGSPNPQTDNSTDHFVVIVGMGTDSDGDYFRFFDNASGSVSQGASLDNKLYYDSSTGLISGTSETNYASGLTYIITMIRKSKLISD